MLNPEDDVPRTELVLVRHELLALGYTGRRITASVRDGTLVRVRRDRYLLTCEHASIGKAVRLGGRLTCVSAIAVLAPEAFVQTRDHLHVHAERTASRLRLPGDAKKRWSAAAADGVLLSRRTLSEPAPSRHLVAVPDAVREILRCLPTREAVATLDSLLRLRVLDEHELRGILAGLPRRFAEVLDAVDPRCESGPESYMRLILRELGVDFEVQVRISGVGRVDFVVAGFLIVECDSKAHHEGWEKQQSDRKRDLEAARRGYFTLRVLAEDLMHHPDRVKDALIGLLAARGIDLAL